MNPILVTGGTGTLGRRVVPLLRGAGREVRVLSRHAHAPSDGVEYLTGDLLTGVGIQAAVDGAGTIVHCAGSSKGDDVATGNLVRAASRAGAQHLVYISVIGADRMTVTSAVDRTMFGYFAAKRAAEQIVTDSGLPWTTLRAAQFHDLLFMVVEKLARLPVWPVPSGARFQPVDTGEVAARLVELALGAPSGLVADLAGPRAYTPAELLTEYQLARGRRRRPVLPVRLPGRAARALRAGATLPLGPTAGRRTWEEFLAERTGDLTGAPGRNR